MNDRPFSSHVDGRERPLRWIGRGLAEVGLRAGDELTPEQFDLARALMQGKDPRTGETLVEPKLAVPDDAKVASAPLVRAVEEVASEADVSVEEVLGHKSTLLKWFAAAKRAVSSYGEAARMRADQAGAIAEAVAYRGEPNDTSAVSGKRFAHAGNLTFDQIWGDGVFAQAEANLFETVTETHADGTVTETRQPRRAVVGNAGYGIDLGAPKSYSVLLAFAEPDLAAKLEDIYLEQAKRAFAWLEDLAAYGMRGHHGDGVSATTVQGSGFLGWMMVHRSARPVPGAEVGDPHWHVHFTIANMTRGQDGKWSTIAAGGRDLMRHVATLDHLFQALVRHELNVQFGIQFERNARTGLWETVGIPDHTLRRFSKRHSDIQQMLAKLGFDPATASRQQQRIAEQQTRGRKTETATATDETLQQLYQAEEQAAGYLPEDHMRRVFANQARPAQTSSMTGRWPADDNVVPRVPADARGASVEEIATLLLDPDTGLTAHSRRFSRADALMRVADALPAGSVSPEVVESLTDAVLLHAGFLRLPDYERLVEGPDGEKAFLAAEHMANAQTYTTGDVVEAEKVILRAAEASHDDQLSTRVDDTVVGMAADVVEAVKHPLDDEQREALRRLVTSGRAVDTVEGGPGSGKTTMMLAVRVAYEAAGYVVAGAATQAVAAQKLQSGSGIPSDTVASLGQRIDGGDPGVLRGVDVLVLDEANLTEDRDRARLYAQAAATGTKIIEIGDSHQLRGVGIGSLFAHIHRIVGGAELRNNRRQAAEDERDAIAAWRDGRYTAAVSVWQGKGRFVPTERAEDSTAAMLAQWWEQRQGAPDAHTEIRGLVMLCATNEQVQRLNTAAQEIRRVQGELGAGRTYQVAGQGPVRFYVGDHVLLRVNDRTGQHTAGGTTVFNGYRGVIQDIADDGKVLVEWQQETADGDMHTHHATVLPSYLALGGVELGYAMTVHKSEGLTVGDKNGLWQRPDDNVHQGTVLFDIVGAANPAAYVAISRHVGELYVFGSLEGLETHDEGYLLGKPRSSQETLDRAIARLAQRARATAEHGDDRPVVVDLKLREFDYLRAEYEKKDADREKAHDDIRQERDEEDRARQERVERRARRDRERAEQQAETKARRQWAQQLLREHWQDEPDLVKLILASPRFDRVARNLHDAAEAGFSPRDVLAELSPDTIASPHIHDKARFAAWSIDDVVKDLRAGQPTRQARAEGWQQMRDQTEELLQQSWPQHPELAQAVIHHPKFTSIVRALEEYTTAGLDARELLQQLPTEKIAHADQPARLTAYLLHHLAEPLLEAADDEHERSQQREAQLQQHRDAEALLREAWRAARQAVDRVVNDEEAFGAFAYKVDQAREAGHDVREALASVRPSLVMQPWVRSPAALVTARFTRAITAQAVARHQHDEAAALVREAWQHAPLAAERVVTGPAFSELIARMDAARAAGHDPRALLAQLDAEALTTRGGPSPSGTVAFAFQRALQRAQQETPVPPVSAQPTATTAPDAPHDADRSPASQPEMDNTTIEPAAPDEETEHSAGHALQAETPESAAVPRRSRPHADLSTAALQQHIDTENRTVERLTQDLAAAEDELDQLHSAVEAGQGPAVLALDRHVAQIRLHASQAREADTVDSQSLAQQQTLQEAIEQRNQAEALLQQLSPYARDSRAILTARIQQLTAAENTARIQAERLAERSADLQHRVGTPEQRQHLLTRARAVEERYRDDRHTAQRNDEDTVLTAHRHVEEVAGQLATARQRLDGLLDERTARETPRVRDQQTREPTPDAPEVGQASRSLLAEVQSRSDSNDLGVAPESQSTVVDIEEQHELELGE